MTFTRRVATEVVGNGRPKGGNLMLLGIDVKKNIKNHAYYCCVKTPRLNFVCYLLFPIWFTPKLYRFFNAGSLRGFYQAVNTACQF